MKDKVIKGANIEKAFQIAVEYSAASKSETNRALAFEYRLNFDGMTTIFKAIGLDRQFSEYSNKKHR